ncbi:Nif3-like dinuclear metal center hexameric protein [Shewanella intestini]|uniref:Nif3-like dinuclear metal center hexameric protein n=1 Tax=Shewanella intestini TaxID=2017544 RepID=A0ABS5I3C5_9GAMM|nr:MULTISPECIES: Nif3-like dinuclear metal center hexameric protein [Shewanella]MBR9727835.1 Nif3-like dinuclear metal center hexameric protein [Shewanella intestini]MRG36172.1 Nif3-like dinuclear metal center hexameric protein [Shewanella sp. XMDDZSB0408]
MTISSKALALYLNDFLQVGQYKDYAPNGLQVEGKAEINRIVTGVTACQGLIEKAIVLKADAILVHHGFFWKNEPEVITGMKYKRISRLIKHDINLFGYHLPLDGHETLGNNVQLAKQLGIEDVEICVNVSQNLLWQGKLNSPLSGEQLTNLLTEKLAHKPLHIEGGEDKISTLAWCTGGAQDYIDIAAQLGVDAFISGEVSERTFHNATEQGIHYFAAGHHATERFGIQALGEHLAQKFGIEHQFVDIYNPV